MFGQQQQNTSVCRYYLKGVCRYGSSCWYLHPQDHGGTISSAAFGSSQQDSKEFREFVKQVSGEMVVWERSGLWLLSSMGPLKEHPNISCFIDTSTEELRVSAYEAVKANNLSSYQTEVLQKHQLHKELRDALRNMTHEAVEVLRKVFFNRAGATSLFRTPSEFSVFGGNQPSLFGGSSPQKSENSGNVFGSVFTAQANTATVFGQASQSQFSLFENTSNKIFDNSNLVTTNAFPLASENANSLWGSQSSSIFGSKPMGTPFDHQSSAIKTNTSPGIFGGNASQNVFGSTQVSSSSNNASIFMPSQSNSIFTSDQPTLLSSLNSPASAIFPSGSANPVFSSSMACSPSSSPVSLGIDKANDFHPTNSDSMICQTNNLFSQDKQESPIDNDATYTPISELTDADREQFTSESFSYIPIMPPPKEFCT